jgi:hypothetical protein
MADQHQQRGTQDQSSGQSALQGGQSGAPAGSPVPDAQSGIGSGQGPDQPAPEHPDPSQRPSAGTPDIERGSGGAEERTNANVADSLVGDSTGAFKERP